MMTTTTINVQTVNFIEIFDSLKSKQRVKVAMRACMGMRDAETGTPTEYIVGRRGKGRHAETVALLPSDGRKPHPMCKVTLMKRKDYQGTVYVTVAIGDMGATLVSIETV